MKHLFISLLFGLLTTTVYAQWSDTTNQFYDSLDMPVAQAINDQQNSLVIKSESDGGYFIVWEDKRNLRSDGIYTSVDIYAQKYDKDGNRLWTENGIPVATGDDDQQYSNISNGTENYTNYHNANHAASDGNGGFYIAFTTANNNDVYIQHILGNGSRVFADEGYGLAVHANQPIAYYSQPQLIADGNGGFFIGYLSQHGDFIDCDVFCYKDENGSLKSYGGGVMNQYQQLVQVTGECGIYQTPAFVYSMAAKSYYIFPDGQGGCGVAMALETNAQQDFPAYNFLGRAKKDCHVIKDVVYNRAGAPGRSEYFYKKDTVIRAYSLSISILSMTCSVQTDPTDPPEFYSYDSYFINNFGYLSLVDKSVYGVSKVYGTVLHTDGNINAIVVTWNEHDYINSSVTDFCTRGRVFPMEIYDSLPYQLCTDTSHVYLSYNPVPPAGMNKINEGASDVDTLLAPLHTDNSGNFYDYSLTGAGNRVFLVSSSNGLSGSSAASPFYYQEAKIFRQNADSFALKLNTSNKKGIVLGTGTGNDKFLYLSGDTNSNATFYYIGPNGSYYVNASPIGETGKLWWSSLGIPLNSGGAASRYYYPTSAFLFMDTNGKGVVSWSDGRKTPTDYTGQNIYMRHLDKLLDNNYQPPLLKSQLIVDSTKLSSGSTYSNSSSSNPQSLSGISDAWTTFSIQRVGIDYNAVNLGGAPVTPVAQIKDDYNLGAVTVQVNESYIPAVRTTPEGHPYLGRNYTIAVTNQPPAGASVHVRLIFTKSEFDSLKAHDASVQDPGDLAVLKQPNGTGTLSSNYTPVAGEIGIKPDSWGAIEADGLISGYYIEITISGFSNFFVMSANSILPVSLQGFTATALKNTSLLQWHTVSETNNSHFDIERSADDKNFIKIGTVRGYGTTSIPQDYNFTDQTPIIGNNYYRLAQVDMDGKTAYSETRLLTFGKNAEDVFKAFPNPSKGAVHIQFSGAAEGGKVLEIFSSAGQKVFGQIIVAGTMQQDIDISLLQSGIYILKYGNENVKIIKI
ncbi:MAG: T9SS type A sorting domain-containing protein [Arachidicoccus sp.]|nr:T9SS type A sorting domain-containing protein [Arachidicoccus sp.]